MPKVQQLPYTLTHTGVSQKWAKKKQKLDKIRESYQDPWRYTQSDRAIKARLTEISHEQMKLLVEKKQLLAIVKQREQLKHQHRAVTVKLYALELEDSCWYVGMSYNVQKRFKQHGGRKGAAWTKIHAPLSVYEVRDTKLYDQDSASKLEDDMTLEYALKYGSDKVRGGGYCQIKPKWPSVVRENKL